MQGAMVNSSKGDKCCGEHCMHEVTQLTQGNGTLDGSSRAGIPTNEGEASNHGAVVLAGQDFVAGHHRPIPLVAPLDVLYFALFGCLALSLDKAEQNK